MTDTIPMPTPRFSVVIPTRNGDAYIGAAIESVLSQTYPHFEIIILEHESQDRTLEIARSYGDPRIQIRSTQEHQTIETNWARMLDLELAEYLTILGHDDIFYPDFLQTIADLIGREPDASLYMTHFHIIDSAGNVIRPCQPIPYRESADQFMRARQQFKRDVFATGYVMRSADYKRVGGFPPFKRLYYSDEYTFYRLANLSEKVCSPGYHFGYRYHRKSESYLSGLDTLTEASLQLVAALQQTDYGREGANLALAQDYVRSTVTRRYLRILIHAMRHGDQEAFRRNHAVREAFLRQTPRHRTSAYDWAARIVEAIIRLPAPPLHRLVAKGLDYLVIAKRGIKD